MTTKTQLQNAADAAALAGASGLTVSPEEAVERAIQFASYNVAVQDSLRPVRITPEDITFPQPNRIRVVTHRTAASGDPLGTYFLRLADLARPNTADVSAVAMAELMPICNTDCVKPWAAPDRWNDVNGNGVYDPGEPYDPLLTGYVPPGDIGVQIVLKVGSPQQAPSPGQFYPVDFPVLGWDEPPRTGGDWYREWIMYCCPFVVGVGDSIQLEPGNMVGPTMQAVEEMIALDPDAYWDEGNRTIMGSRYGLSPRLVKVPFFDPSRPPDQGRQYVYVAKIGAFFLESVGPGSRVNARFMQFASQGTPCDPGAPPSFVYGFILTQ